MEQGSYLKMLYSSLLDVQCSLLASLEKKDYIQYIESESIRREYASKIGPIEKETLEIELEVNLLEKKKQRIQVALNRNESIDLNQLDEELNLEKENMLQQLNASYDASYADTGEIQSADLEELKRLYKLIVEEFHPEVHNLTENQKQLYEKAVTCYQNRKLEELQVIYDMLTSTKNMSELSLDLSFSLTTGTSETTDADVLEYVNEIGQNYTLAKKVFSYFKKSEEELILFNTKVSYESKQKAVLEVIEQLYNSFPLNAKETLQDENKLNEYIQSLQFRKQVATKKMNQLNQTIDEMIKELPQ